jgi:hypothetical protein
MTFFCTLRAAPKCKVRWGHHVVNGWVMPDVPGGPCYACNYFVTDLEQEAVRTFGVRPELRVFQAGKHTGDPVVSGEHRTALPNLVREARRAQARAQVLRARFVKHDIRAAGFKVAASDGEQTLSGHRRLLDDTGFASVDRVRRLADEIGHRFAPHELDRLHRKGKAGNYHACHAEKQLAVLTEDTCLGTSQALCSDCQSFFRKLAEDRKKTYVVAEPRRVKVFLPDGSVYDLEER